MAVSLPTEKCPSYSDLDKLTENDDVDDDEGLLTDDEEDEKEVGEEQAILTWLYTFPQVSQVSSKAEFLRSWSNDDNIQSCLLSVSDEICDALSPSNSFEPNSENRENLLYLVCNRSSEASRDVSQMPQSRVFALSSLLCRAVSEDCNKRGIYISRIMSLNRDIQRALMHIIETNKAQEEEKKKISPVADDDRSKCPEESYLDDLTYDDDDDESLLNDDENDGINLSMNEDKENSMNSATRNHHKLQPLTPRFVPNRSPLSPVGTNSSFSSRKKYPSLMLSPYNSKNVVIERLESEIEELRTKNQNYFEDIGSMRAREGDLSAKLEEIEAKHRAAMLKIESENLERETKLHDDHSRQINILQEELQSCRDSVHEAAAAKEKLTILQDEVDVLQHSNEKLLQTEEQVRRLKQKLEQLSDVNDALKKEEKAHGEAVASCLDLENELASLQPLRRQLEEYKSRAVDAEVCLADCEEDLKKYKGLNENLTKTVKELEEGSLRQQEETEELRRKLIHDGETSTNQDGGTVGDGITELNPVLKEELLRLRNENIRLKAFAAKREEDSVQLMEEKLDDSGRLVAKFKEEFLSTKNKLEDTKEKLKDSLNREKVLEGKVADLEGKNKQLVQAQKEERISHQKAMQDADRTLHSTKKKLVEQARQDKDNLEKTWMSKLEDECRSSKDKIEKCKEDMVKAEERNAEIMLKLREESSVALQKEKNQCRVTIENIEREHRSKVKEIEIKAIEERDKLIEKGKQMIKETKAEAKKKAEEKEKENEERLSQEKKTFEDLRQFQIEYEEKAKAKIGAYKQKLQVALGRHNQISSDFDSLQDKMKKLECEKRNLQNEIDRLKRQLGGRLGSDSNVRGQYESLQREFNHLLEENRELKKQTLTNNFSLYLESDSTKPEISTETSSLEKSESYVGGGTSAGNNSALSQLRTEYEETIAVLTDEKRELIMKNSAAITDVQKEKQRSWELEKDVEKLKNEITSIKLQIERNGRLDTANSSPARPRKRLTRHASPAFETLKSVRVSNLKESGTSDGSSHITDKVSLTDINEGDSNDLLESDSFESTTANLSPRPPIPEKLDNFKSKLAARLSAKKATPGKRHPSLLEYTMPGRNLDSEGKQECQQS